MLIWHQAFAGAGDLQADVASSSMLWALRELAAAKPAGTKVSLVTSGLLRSELSPWKKTPLAFSALGELPSSFD